MIQLKFQRHRLYFKFAAGTSRGTMHVRDGLFILVYDAAKSGPFGIGEVGPLPGLSPDILESVEQAAHSIEHADKITMPAKLVDVEAWLDRTVDESLPSLRFGLEVALRDYFHGGERLIYDNGFFSGARSLPINGLIWMGEKRFMTEQIEKKISEGFRCIKLKIGALDIDTELDLLKYIRRTYSAESLELRVDANGAFSPDDLPPVLDALASYGVHSIEQPILPGQWDVMSDLCRNSPVPIALDEELIALNSDEEREAMLSEVGPQFLVLKPTLLGGFAATGRWIEIAEKHGIGWWVTSALESNIGLSAIAQFVSQYHVEMPQGLGTGQLYTNNIPSPLMLEGDSLRYDCGKPWDLSAIGLPISPQ